MPDISQSARRLSTTQRSSREPNPTAAKPCNHGVRKGARHFLFSRFRFLGRNIELLNLGDAETGVISLFNSVLKECGQRVVGWTTGYIQPPNVKYLQAPPHVRLPPLKIVTATFYIDGELY